MPILQLPHRTADYLCPINGLADIYQWKTGERIPDELLFYARSGFLLLSSKKEAPPKMILLSTCSIGRKQYEFWAKYMGYRLHAGDGKTFRNALKDIRALLDNGIPVIIFGLDMYHLGYHEKFFHQLHVPGHVVLMVGYNDNKIYIHDNSKEGIQEIHLTDLEHAWGDSYLNISKKNCYFGVEFSGTNLNSKEILSRAYADMANRFLKPPVSFMGSSAVKRLISELPDWYRSYDHEILERILQFFIMFTGSVLPELPKELCGSNLADLDNPRKGTRDKFSCSLVKYYREFGNSSWISAAEHFSESGELIKKIADKFVQDIRNQSHTSSEDCAALFEALLKSETKAYLQFCL